MPSITKLLTPEEKHQVEVNLDQLFILQDKPLPEAKKTLLVNEVANTGYPLLAILQGLRALRHADMRSLKLANILDSISKFVDINAGRAECPHCIGTSSCIEMYDDEARIFAVACKCANGDLIAKAQGLTRWTGQDVMMSQGRRLYKKRSLVGSNAPVVEVQNVDETIRDLVEAVGGKVTDQGTMV